MDRVNPHSSARPSRARGFTLIELLVSMAVLTLMMTMVAQVFNSTIRATSNSQNQIGATRQARAVLDMIHEDLGSQVLQNGAATVFVKTDTGTTPANSQLVFVSSRRAPQGATAPRFTASSYVLDSAQMLLTRNFTMISWSTADLMKEAFKIVGNPPTTPATASGTVDGVLRLEVGLLLDNGDIVPLTATGSWSATTFNGDPVPQGFSALVPTGDTVDPAKPKVRALIVGVASLDPKILRVPGASTLAAALPPAPSGKTPLETWTSVIDQGGLAAFPRPAAAGLRIQQSTFSLQ